MTTLNEARTDVYTRFTAEWVSGSAPLTPYCFDNEKFDPPKDANGGAATWARCSVRSMPGGQETLGRPGNRKYTRQAIVRVEVYTPPGSGLQPADTLVQAALAMFEGRSLLGSTIKLYDASSAEVGLVDEGRWFLSTIQVYFDYEEVK